MDKKKFGIMLVGCGHIGSEHLADIYYRDNIQIVAVVDTDLERAKLFAKKYGAKYFGTDYKEYLPLSQIDIVIIATYSDSHLKVFKDCLKFGKHVLCEKPMASNAQDSNEFYLLARSAKVKVQIAHILRHNKSYQKIAELIDSGAIGELKLIRMVQNHHAMNWERYKRLLEDCPPAVDCGVHYFDIMQWFSKSPITKVSGFSQRLDNDITKSNYNMVNVTMQNGCKGYFEAGWSPSLAAENIKEFVGDSGRIRLIMESFRSENREEGDLIALYDSKGKVYSQINLKTKYKDMYAQLSFLINLIENDSSHVSFLEDAYKAHVAAFSAQAACELCETVEIPAECPMVFLKKSV